MTGHTPGPWSVVEDPEDRGRYVVAGPDMVGIVMTPAGKHRNEPLRSFLADARLIAAAPDQNETLRAEAAFLRRHLEKLIHVSVTGAHGHIVNGFAAAQIPDWEMRQRLDDIETVLAKAEGR